ncbi:MAG: response regulator [Gammaproteobacteria bacterium]|jgi:two-component system, NtrC family, nitrogen regulation response regulator NtrX|nr:response regulator [Gammaproteobacteria bacterium]MBU0773177.1 response regulator [Gammaproteobacteria bacterium]MBU0855426.1 response regulator [Gammaproteobacteria bacterium]MBU1848912.1 response regulator [Gammaproteobacteria bacterium]
MARILVVDDEMGIRELLSEILGDEGHDVTLAENAAAARSARQSARPDLVLLDIWMPDTDGISLLKEWASSGQLNMPVIMMSGHGTIDSAVEATRIGAMDFLEKPIALAKLLSSVKRALARSAPAEHRPAAPSLAGLGRSATLRDLRRRLEQMAGRSRVIMLRCGPSSFAELAARTLATPGRRWLDLPSITGPVTQEQLDATRGGVIHAGDIATMSRMQQKNLSFAVDRLDRLDARLIASCAPGPTELHLAGWDDALLSRLFEVVLPLPPLADLRDEVPELADEVLKHLADVGEIPARRLTDAARPLLRQHGWPGGYVELVSVLRSAALAALDEELDAPALRPLLRSAGQSALPGLDQPLREAREAFERLYFEHHMEREGGNMTRLAERSGLERTHLYRKLKQLGLAIGRRTEAHD